MKPNKTIGYLGYNSGNDRYGILNDMDLWLDNGLHCGECIEVYLNGEWVADRLEYLDEWYLVYSKLKGDSLEHLKVRY